MSQRRRHAGRHATLPNPSIGALAIRECAVKGESTQPVKVRPKEVSVGLGSYPGDGEGDPSIEAPGTETRRGRVCKRAGRNASEA